MINLNNIRFFYLVAKRSSFTIAATDLYVTQSAVTKRVRRLEEQLKLKLFVKYKGKALLTEEGRSLFEYAEKIIEYEELIENEIKDVKELKKGIFRIGFPKTVPSTLIDFLIDIFHDKYPHIKLELITGNSNELMNKVLNHRIDIALHQEKVQEHQDIHYIQIARLKTALLAGPAHHFSNKKAISFNELEDELIVIQEAGSGMHHLITNLFKGHQIEPNILFESNNPDVIRQIIKKGKGVSFFIEMSIAHELDKGDLIKIPIKDCEIFSNIFLTYLKSFPLTLPAREYLRLFAEKGSDAEVFNNLDPSWTHNCQYID